MADRVNGRGKIIVAAAVAILVALAVVFGMLRTGGETSGRQGKMAPDSNEGSLGAGSPASTRETPALNPGTAPEVSEPRDTGRNAPADPTAQPQDAPTGSLTDGPNADPEESREPGRAR